MLNFLRKLNTWLIEKRISLRKKPPSDECPYTKLAEFHSLKLGAVFAVVDYKKLGDTCTYDPSVYRVYCKVGAETVHNITGPGYGMDLQYQIADPASNIDVRPGSLLVRIWDPEIGIKEGHCPDCGSGTFLEGPHGGLAVNIRCAYCGSEFNFSYPFSCDRIDRNLPEAYHTPFHLQDWLDEWDEHLGRKPKTRKHERNNPGPAAGLLHVRYPPGKN